MLKKIRWRLATAWNNTFAIVRSTSAPFVPSEEAKRQFASSLDALLKRSEPDQHTCRFCGHANQLSATTRVDSNCLFTQQQLRRFKCSGCGGVFGPVPLIECSQADLAELYTCLYKFFREGYSQPFQEKTFYLMNPSRRGEYLNYACGDWSEGCERLRSLGWLVWGYEPFQKITSGAIFGDRQKVLGRTFDGLMSHNFIEHVQSPLEFFRECNSMIKCGGTMAHSSACYDYIYEISPFHLFFYCGDSVVKLAERSGFRLLAEHRVDRDFPGSQYGCCVFEKIAETGSSS